jgi:HSP20 family protein
MAIQRWDPFNDLRMIDDTVNRMWRGFGGTPAGGESWNVLLDVVQHQDDIIVKASIPGVKASDIELSFEDNVLTIKAERKLDYSDEQTVYLIHERPVGTFYRALRVPETIDAGKIQSSYEDGVLTIVLPKAEEKKEKQIKIEVKSGAKAIEAK